MSPVVFDHLGVLRELCSARGVRRLELFGSAARGDFDPQTSDLDFLVEFMPMTPAEHYEAYFGLWEDLQRSFHRPVDLVEAKAVRNRCLIEDIRADRTVIYHAP